MKTTCISCAKEFNTRPSRIKNGHGKYCSNRCTAKGRPKIQYPTLEKRLWDKIDQSLGKDKCWPFTGSLNACGYGTISKERKSELAHRVVYALLNGDIPSGCVIMHTCDNPCCCNPGHLKCGTQQENIADMNNKHRRVSLAGEKAGAAKLTKEQVQEIKDSFTGRHGQKREFATKFNISHSSICNVLKGRTWKCIDTIPLV